METVTPSAKNCRTRALALGIREVGKEIKRITATLGLGFISVSPRPTSSHVPPLWQDTHGDTAPPFLQPDRTKPPQLYSPNDVPSPSSHEIFPLRQKVFRGQGTANPIHTGSNQCAHGNRGKAWLHDRVHHYGREDGATTRKNGIQCPHGAPRPWRSTGHSLLED